MLNVRVALNQSNCFEMLPSNAMQPLRTHMSCEDEYCFPRTILVKYLTGFFQEYSGTLVVNVSEKIHQVISDVKIKLTCIIAQFSLDLYRARDMCCRAYLRAPSQQQASSVQQSVGIC